MRRLRFVPKVCFFTFELQVFACFVFSTPLGLFLNIAIGRTRSLELKEETDPKLTIDKFSEWQQVHEEQTFKKPEAFVSSSLLVGFI